MLTGVIIFLLLLIALLAIPVTLTFKVSWRQAFQGDIRLLWLFGLVRIQLPSSQSKISPAEGNDLAHKISHSEHLSGKKTNYFKVVWLKAFRRRIIRFISDFWHAVQKRNVILRIRIGLGDPADTGLLWTAVGPVAGVLANVQEASIEFEPEFFDTVFELQSSGNIRLIPLQLIYLMAGLMLSPPVWQAILKSRCR